MSTLTYPCVYQNDIRAKVRYGMSSQAPHIITPPEHQVKSSHHWDQTDNIADKVFVLHTANSDSTPEFHMVAGAPTGMTPESRVLRNP